MTAEDLRNVAGFRERLTGFSSGLAETSRELARLAEDALRDHRAGRTRPLDPEAE